MNRGALLGMAAVLLTVSVESATARQFNIFIPPECELDQQHFMVRNAALYVKAGTEARDDEQKQSAVQDAHRVLMDALEQGEEGNAAVWYFLGRNYALVPDLAGADSAFKRAVGLAPDCAEDVDTHRRFLWVPLYNEGITALQDGDQAAAKAALAEADKINDTEAFIPYYLASILLQEQDVVGAIRLFKKMTEMGQTEGDYEEPYLIALFNSGRLSHMTQQWDSAAVWYARYRAVVPDDRDALTGLASVLEASGRVAEAVAAHDTIIEYAASVTPLDLFSTGVSLFQYRRFDRAVDAFTMGLENNEYYRDGLYNLTQSYFAIANPSNQPEGVEPTTEQLTTRTRAAEDMLRTAQRLREVDPFNESSMRLLAAAFQLTGELDSTAIMMERIETLPYEVTIDRFQPSASGYQLTGAITNRMEDQLTIPNVTLEFVDASGNVLEEHDIGGATLDSQARSEFQFSPVIEGVAAWRYRLNR